MREHVRIFNAFYKSKIFEGEQVMKEIEIKNVKGTFDYLPKEQIIRNHVTNVLTEVFESFGYLPVVTPTLCYYDVLASKYGGGAEILKEVYQLSDQGERNLALRYDLTVPFAKLITLTKDLTLPFKRYEIGKVFRDGPVKVGRNREFIQCDVDVVGVQDVLIDAELISLYVMAFERLNISCTIDYNNRKLMTGLLQVCGVTDEQMVDVITVIDKFKKLTKEEIIKEFLACGITMEQIEKLYEYFRLGFEGVVEKFSHDANELIQKGIQELKEVEAYLNKAGIHKQANIDLTLARGLNIYTGTVFEVFAHDSKVTSAIGGGGRYDKIITNFIADGNEYPAVGCSFGLDAIVEVVKEHETKKSESLIDLFLIPLGTKTEAFLLAYELRKRGVHVDIQYYERKLNKILNSIDRLGISYAVVLGEDEVSKGEITLKCFQDGSTHVFAIDAYDEIASLIQNF